MSINKWNFEIIPTDISEKTLTVEPLQHVRYSVPYGNLKNKKIMRLLQSKRRTAIAPQLRFILKNKAAIGTLSNKSIIKLTLPIGSEGGVTLGIRIGVCCRILQIASLFHMSFLTPVLRPSFLKSIRLMTKGFLTLYLVCKAMN